MVKCNVPKTSVFIENVFGKYSLKPCCLPSTNLGYVDDIADIWNTEMQLDSDICAACVAYGNKRRQQSFEDPTMTPGKLTHWDIRPGNTCNLKCVMCGPDNSSKWNEDIDIFNQFNDQKPKPTRSIDWDYIYKHSINKARLMYFAGGEPFYMKEVTQFLERLSEFEWNRKNTRIDFNTNGVSCTDKTIDILNRYDNVRMSISIDGIGNVNELIRYPTRWRVFREQLKILKKFDHHYNVTVSALNLPVIDDLNIFCKGNMKLQLLTFPKHLSINCLKPDIVYEIYSLTRVDELLPLLANYKYNSSMNQKMQDYLTALDSKRNTDSRSIIPWCFE